MVCTMTDMSEPDFRKALTSFAARVAGCLRVGLSVPDAVKHSATVGWIFRELDRDQKGKSWRWPGPQDFVVDDEFVDLVVKNHPSASREELSLVVGMVFPANHESSGSDDVSSAAPSDKKNRFKKPVLDVKAPPDTSTLEKYVAHVIAQARKG